MKKLFTLLFIAVFALITFKVSAQQNIIVGGDMSIDAESSWMVTTLETDPANTSSYEFGYESDVPWAGDGAALHFTIENTGANGAHLMFYQEVTIEHGQHYICNMAAKAIQEMNNSWFEVYLGTDEPADGADYGSGQTALGGFKWSGWEAGCEGLDLFDGTLRNDGCLAGSTDTILIEGEGSSTMYLGFKAGIWGVATTVEFSIDDVTLVNLDVVSANEIEASKTNIYPNPVNNSLNIESNSTFTSARIFNVVGQEVLNATSFSNQLDVSALKTGIYMLELVGENNQVEIQKFQKN